MSTASQSRSRLWYQREEPEEQAAALVGMARALWTDQGTKRRQLADDAMTLWSGTTQHGLTGANPMSVLGLIDGTAGQNFVQKITDTKVNATLRNEVRPLFVTEGGDSELREKVNAMQDACDGQRYALGLDGGEMSEQACWNGYIFGNGGVEFWSDSASSRIMVTPAWFWQYFVSRQEAINGAPQQQFSRHLIPRDVLRSFLADSKPEVLQAIDDAPSASWDDARTYEAAEPGRVVDMVVIYKAWHLPSSRVDLDDPKSFGRNKGDAPDRRVKANHDGMHMVCLESGQGKDVAPLLGRAWPYEHYPTSWFKPNRVPGSWWGRGEPEILAAAQIESNQWNERVYQVIDRHARPAIILGKGAKLNPAMINNSPFNIWQVEGNPSNAMTVLNAPAVSGDLINRLDRLPQMAADQRGMSEMSMTARRPTGINHEPGMAYLANTETIRHTAEFKAWERFNLDCSKNIIRCLNELSEFDPDYEVIFEKDDSLIRQNWKEIYAGPSKYRIKAKGTNLFKQDPAEQAEQIADLIEKGVLPPDSIFDAVKSPDLQMLAGDRNIVTKNIEKRLDAIVKGPDFTDDMMPAPHLDMNMALKLCIQRMNKVEFNGESADKLNRLNTFRGYVQAEIAKAMPPAPVAPPGAGPMPLAPPNSGPPGVTAAPPTIQ
jgi:hypothetical protein